MLRLPRAAHYSICESLCARDTANLIETASQWSRKDDPRHAAMRACVADRVARARVVTGYVGEIVSPLKFLEAVERRDWEITPTGRDGDCNGQLRKIFRSYNRRGGLKDGDDIVFLAGREYRFVRTFLLHAYSDMDENWFRFPQITFRGVGGPSKPLLYADADTLFCLFHIRGPSINNEPNPIIQFSGLAFRNDTRFASRRNSIVRYRSPNVFRMDDCHVRTLRCRHWGQDAGGHPVLEPLHCANMEECSEEVG